MVIQRISKSLQKVFGSRNERVLKRYWGITDKVNSLEPSYQQMPDSQLRLVTDQLRDRIAGGEEIYAVLPDAFAAIREASDRHLGIRNVFLDENKFDTTQLSGSTQTTYKQLKEQFNEGTALDDLDVPVEFNAEIRELYPESRPPFRFRHFDVQIIGGNILFNGSIAEMATGEGKTLVATLATYLTCLTDKKVHVVTVNDYLAKRDADWMTPVYSALGLTIGAIQANMDTTGQERKDKYKCNITYGTNNEFGFDYLRDNMKISAEQMAQGPLDYALIDEVDSILVDEARTPLIISGPAFDDITCYKKADTVCHELLKLQENFNRLQKKIDTAKRTIANAQGELSEAKEAKDNIRIEKAQKVIERTEHERAEAEIALERELEGTESQIEESTLYYNIDYERKSVTLMELGDRVAQKALGMTFHSYQDENWRHRIEQSLRAHLTFEKEKAYVVLDGKIVIVDEFTGRLMEGRQWSDGLHQAIEAKEGVKVKEETQTLATITLQNFFKLYERLAGMTGTAETEAEEFLDIYKLDVVVIPTNRPCIRDDRNDLIFKSLKEKFNAIADEISEVSTAGRPVLVGTVSIEKSEAISRALTSKYNLDHEVLNAKQHQREASIVEKAGHQQTRRDGKMLGNITIATNMAGRGTDIKLGPGVADIGGLHIVGTERHESRRIDNQLRGRAGRQGDAGSSEFFLCFDDDLLSIFAPEWTVKALAWIGWEEGQPIYHSRISKGIEKAQKKVEERNFEARKSLLEYDEVMDFQRKYFYTRRRNIIEGMGLKEVITEMVGSIITRACDNILAPGYPYNCIVEWARSSFNVDLTVKGISGKEVKEIEEFIKNSSKKTISNEISLSIGEYLEDRDDRKAWNLDSLAKWAMSSFAVSLSAGKLRHMDYDEISDTLIEGACHQVDKKDYSQMSEFLKDNFAIKSFTQLMSSRFDIKLTTDDLKELKPEQANQLVVDKVTEKYEQRELEYPAEFAMNMVYGPQGPNIYGFESVATWAKLKYNADLSVEDMQQLKPAKLHEQLLALSKSFSDGELDKEIDFSISSLAPNALADWASSRFEAKLDAEDMADPSRAKELLGKAAAEFMRTELSDLEKYVLIQIYDSTWKDHLYAMDHLKESIFLRAFAEKDPKIEYKHESHRMFNEMLDTIEDRVTNTIFKVRLDPGQQRRNVWNVSQTQHDEVGQFSMAERQRAAATAPQGEQKVRQIKLDQPKVGRNEPCSCGSGKKYKKCCGKNG